MPNQTIHFIGIGGMGQSALATAFLEQGYTVQGSDPIQNEYTAVLEKLGVRIWTKQAAENLKNADIVIFSTAIPAEHIERKAAADLGLEILHRSQGLDLLAKNQKMIAVAGTHGKSSTSALLVSIFEEAARNGGAPFSYAVGAPIRTKSGSISGGHFAPNSKVFIAEADESDKSFLNYNPWASIILNIDADHLDNYNDLREIIATFAQFATKVSDFIILNADDPGVQSLLLLLKSDSKIQPSKIITFCQNSTFENLEDRLQNPLDFHITDIATSDDGLQQNWQVTSEKFSINQKITINSPAKHNVINATAAFIAAVLSGVKPNITASGIGNFVGAEHRFEIKGEVDDILIIDDYAHHPTAIAALLKSACQLQKKRADNIVNFDGKIRILYQPLVFSRTRILQKQIARSLELADEIVITSVFDSREPFDSEITPQTITQHLEKIAESEHKQILAITDLQTALEQLLNDAKPGDLLLLAGGGDIGIRTRGALTRLKEIRGESA